MIALVESKTRTLKLEHGVLGLGCCFEADPDVMIVVESGRQVQKNRIHSNRLEPN